MSLKGREIKIRPGLTRIVYSDSKSSSQCRDDAHNVQFSFFKPLTLLDLEPDGSTRTFTSKTALRKRCDELGLTCGALD
jgi:hypothetical protein